MPNTCWECKNHSLKLNVLVPYDRTIKEYVHRTGNFKSDIAALIKKTYGQYTVWFRSEDGIKPVTVEMIHTCRLRIERNNQAACSCYKQAEQSRISSITYTRLQSPKTPLKPDFMSDTCMH
jgi:hypothetical protein